MLSNNQKVGCVAKLSAWDDFITAGKRDDAKRKRAALSSLPLRIRRESDRLTSGSLLLGVACTDRARLCMPSVALGGEGVLRLLRSAGCPGDEAKTHLCNGADYELRKSSEALFAYVQRKMGMRFYAIAHS